MAKNTKSRVWTRNDLKNPHEATDKRERVRQMFDAIAERYDFLNHLLSFNWDRRWRRRGAELARLQKGETVLDLCCGTGAMATALVKMQPELNEVVGVDFSAEMLKRAREKYRHKSGKINWLCTDAEQVPLPDMFCDCITCVFGIRNVQQPDKVFQEMYRLLRPGGRVVILEFALPAAAVPRWLFQVYFRLVLPLLGGIMVQDVHRAYAYLPHSVLHYDTRRRLQAHLVTTGFVNLQIERLSGGMVLALIANKA